MMTNKKRYGAREKDKRKYFWRKINQCGLNGCWEWTASKDRNGYGMFRHETLSSSRGSLAHRFSWEIHYGPIPPGLCVLHHCDNPICVRPDHLLLGTNADNMADKI